MNLTVAWITARGLFGQRRALLLLPLPILLIGLGLICRANGLDPAEWAPGVLLGLGLAVVLPVISLIIGTGVLGSEIDDGTIVHILTKPLARREIIFAKLAVAVGVTAVTTAVPLAVTGLLAGSGELAFALAVGAVVGALAYSALFLLLSLVTKRPVLLGLIYILVWEGLLGRYATGTRVLSIEQYVITVVDKLAPTPYFTGAVSVPVALIMSGVFVIGCTALAINRLRSFSVAGES
jgi:ABC-2 type transport system permease protein